MKKATLAFILFTFLSLSLTGQRPKFQFGLTTAVRISDSTYKNKKFPSFEDFLNESCTWRIAPGLAAWTRYNANERVSIQAGLGYDISGYRVKEFTLTSSTPTMPEPVEVGKAKGTIHYHDITIPLSLRWKPGKNNNRFYLTAGVAPLINVGRKQTVVIHFNTGDVSKSTTEIKENSDLRFKDFNLRGDAGFGYYIWTHSRFGIYAEPLFSYTLFPVFTGGGGKMKEWYVGINIGVDL